MTLPKQKTQGGHTISELHAFMDEVDLPIFYGSSQIEDFWAWVDAIEDYFEEMNPPEQIHCRLASYKLAGDAYTWWKKLQCDRISSGKERITAWFRMKKLLFRKFLSTTCSAKCPPQIHNGSQETEEICGKEMIAESLTHANCLTKVPLQRASSKKVQSLADLSDVEGKVGDCGSKDETRYSDSSITDVPRVAECEKMPLSAFRYDTTMDNKESVTENDSSELHIEKAKYELEASLTEESLFQEGENPRNEVKEVKKKAWNLKNEVAATKSIVQMQPNSPTPKTGLTEICTAPHGPVFFNYGDQHKVRRPKSVNRFDKVTKPVINSDPHSQDMINEKVEKVKDSDKQDEMLMLNFDPGGKWQCKMSMDGQGAVLPQTTSFSQYGNINIVNEKQSRASYALDRIIDVCNFEVCRQKFNRAEKWCCFPFQLDFNESSLLTPLANVSNLVDRVGNGSMQAVRIAGVLPYMKNMTDWVALGDLSVVVYVFEGVRKILSISDSSTFETCGTSGHSVLGKDTRDKITTPMGWEMQNNMVQNLLIRHFIYLPVMMSFLRVICGSYVPISSGMEMVYSGWVSYSYAEIWHVDHMCKALYEMADRCNGGNGNILVNNDAFVLGITNQLTNALWDAEEDARRGKTYLHQYELTQTELSDENIFAKRITDKWKNRKKNRINQPCMFIDKATLMVVRLQDEVNLLSCYHFVEKFYNLVLSHPIGMDKQKECLDDNRGAACSLMYAFASLADQLEYKGNGDTTETNSLKISYAVEGSVGNETTETKNATDNSTNGSESSERRQTLQVHKENIVLGGKAQHINLAKLKTDEVNFQPIHQPGTQLQRYDTLNDMMLIFYFDRISAKEYGFGSVAIIACDCLSGVCCFLRQNWASDQFWEDAVKQEWVGLIDVFIPLGNLQTYASLNLTRGRAMPCEGWKNESNANIGRKNKTVESSFVIGGARVNTSGKNGQYGVSERLFHKVVNGLDPPMDLDSAYEAGIWNPTSSLVGDLFEVGGMD